MAIVHEVLVSDGEGLDPVDFNNAQRFLRAQINDVVLRPRTRTKSDTLGASDALCYSIGASANILVTATALRSTNQAGTILQEVSTGATTGNDPLVLMYSLAANELQTDHAAAHATLDRRDIICIKLEHVLADTESRDFEDAATRALTSTTPTKRRNVLLTKQVVAGANAAAGTAVDPSVPAGYCKWASVLIPATHAAVFAPNTHYRDHRYPIGSISSGMVLGIDTINDAVVPFSAAATNVYHRKAFAAGEKCWAVLPRFQAGRVLRLMVLAKISGGGSIRYGRIDLGTGTQTLVSTAVDTAGVLLATDIVTSTPLWANGYQVADDVTAGGTVVPAVFLESGASGDEIVSVTWEYVD